MEKLVFGAAVECVGEPGAKVGFALGEPVGGVVLALVVLFLQVCVCVRCLWLLVAHCVDEGGSGR